MKAECPACKAYLSGVYDALTGCADACPSCLLSGSVMREVESARKAHADADLAGRLETALVRMGQAETQRDLLHERVSAIRQIVAEWDEEDRP